MTSTISNYLIEEYPLIILPKLASVVGLQEAIVLQQVHYWMDRTVHIKDHYRWIYNTFDTWEEQFPFWSRTTIRRIIQRLRESTEDRGPLLIIGNYNKKAYDRTLWYRIDYEELAKMTKEIRKPIVEKKRDMVFEQNMAKWGEEKVLLK